MAHYRANELCSKLVLIRRITFSGWSRNRITNIGIMPSFWKPATFSGLRESFHTAPVTANNKSAGISALEMIFTSWPRPPVWRTTLRILSSSAHYQYSREIYAQFIQKYTNITRTRQNLWLLTDTGLLSFLTNWSCKSKVTTLKPCSAFRSLTINNEIAVFHPVILYEFSQSIPAGWQERIKQHWILARSSCSQSPHNVDRPATSFDTISVNMGKLQLTGWATKSASLQVSIFLLRLVFTYFCNVILVRCVRVKKQMYKTIIDRWFWAWSTRHNFC